VESLMSGAVLEPGKMANWIAAPKRGVKGRPIEFEYVRFD
jgi:benzoyl-CoA 2,3-dioxygenase component B